MPAMPTPEELAAIQNSTLSKLTLENLIFSVLLLIVCTFAIKILLGVLKKMLGRSKLDPSVRSVALSACKILLIFVAIILVAESLGIEATSLLALLSVAGLAASLALQDSLSNMASGVVILVSKPFKAGDYVTVSNLSGTVQSIGITYTKLMTPDNQTILVPNKSITSASITNFTTAGMRRLDLTFSASYDDPTELVKEALLEAADIPAVLKDQPVFVRLNNYGDHAIDYAVRVWVKAEDYWDAHFDIKERVRDCFDRRGITMTYPHLNVHTVS